MWAGKEGVFRARASLRVYGKDLTPAAVTLALQIDPTRVTAGPDSAMWVYSTREKLNNFLPLASHLKHLIDLATPRKEAIRALQRDYSIDVLCYFASQSDIGGFDLPASIMADLGALNIGIKTDEYFCCS